MSAVAACASDAAAGAEVSLHLRAAALANGVNPATDGAYGALGRAGREVVVRLRGPRPQPVRPARDNPSPASPACSLRPAGERAEQLARLVREGPDVIVRTLTRVAHGASPLVSSNLNLELPRMHPSAGHAVAGQAGRKSQEATIRRDGDDQLVTRR